MFAKNLIGSNWGKYYNNQFRGFIKAVRSWPGFGREADKMESWGDDIVEVTAKVMEINYDDFNVFNQGDLWVNNIMFKHDKTGKPIDVLLV